MSSSDTQVMVVWASDVPERAAQLLEQARHEAEHLATISITIQLVHWRGGPEQRTGAHLQVSSAAASVLVLDSSQDLTTSCYELLQASVAASKATLVLAGREFERELVIKLETAEATAVDGPVVYEVGQSDTQALTLSKFLLLQAKAVVANRSSSRPTKIRRPRR